MLVSLKIGEFTKLICRKSNLLSHAKFEEMHDDSSPVKYFRFVGWCVTAQAAQPFVRQTLILFVFLGVVFIYSIHGKENNERKL